MIEIYLATNQNKTKYYETYHPHLYQWYIIWSRYMY